MTSASDVVLEWMSETGSGRWSDVRESIGSLRKSYPDLKRPAWQIAEQLDASGHLDIDWAQDRWSVAPPALALLPHTSLCALWSGARPRAHQRQLASELAEDLGVFDFVVPQPPQGPSALFVKASSVDALRDCAARLGLAFIVDPAAHLAAHLPALDHRPTSPAAEPAPHEPVRQFDAASLDWVPVTHHRAPGLYDIERHGQKLTRWRDAEGEWHQIDRSAGIVAAAVAAGQTELVRWRPAHRTEPSWLEVRAAVPLPKLAQRAAVASSGLLPMTEPGWRRYRNVRREIAEAIARSLGVSLATRRNQEAPHR